MTIKNGRISSSEESQILELAEKLPYGDIAVQFGRNPETVRKLIERKLGKKLIVGGRNTDATYDIKKSMVWKELEDQFSEQELKSFLYHWERTINQFKDDVFPTEQMQVVDMIKLEILMNRILREQRESIKIIDALQEQIDLESKLNENADADKIASLSVQIANHRTAKESLSKEYNQYHSRKENMLKELKATRAERVQHIENSKQTVIGWVKRLLEDNSLRKELGIKMEKFRISVDVEKVRLFTPHKYMDNEIDSPLLTEETIRYLEDKEKSDNAN